MTHNNNNHWSYRFPYMVPVWHSLNHKNLYNLSENYVDPNLDIDIGGIGMYSNTAHRHYRHMPYQTRRPMLPFYVDHNRSTSNYASINCLAYCQQRNLLFSSKFNKISAFDLNINGKRFDVETNEMDSNIPHWCSVNKQVPINPFCFDVYNIWEYKDLSDKKSCQILDIKLYDDGNDLDVMVHSRKSLKIYKYLMERDLERSSDFLQLKINIDSSMPDMFAGSKLDFYDRNPDVSEEFLISFVGNSCLYRWDIEQSTMTSELSLDLDLQTTANNFIGLKWAQNLNPFLYFYGSHRGIFLGDTRQNMNSLKKSSIPIMIASQFAYFREFELFQTFTLNPIEPHQIITASDFNINLFDLRFPNKNLFQCKDMFTGHLTSKLETCKLNSNKESGEKLLLLSSNKHNCCLYTFDNKSCIQPVMEHVPCYIDLPNDTEQCFPTINKNGSNHFIRGMQILPGNCDDELNSSSTHDFFTITLLLNNGDIFMQDYWPSKEQSATGGGEQSQFRTNATNLNEFKYKNNYGKKNCLNFLSDIVTTNYMGKIQNFIENVNNSTDIDHIPLESSEYSLICPVCLKNGFSKRVHESEDSDSDNDFFDSKPSNCSNYEANLCLCQKMSPLSRNKVDNNNRNINYDQNDFVSTKDCKILDGRMKFLDNDPFDLNMLQKNWTTITNGGTSSSSSSSTTGLRSLISKICSPKTVILFDRWCNNDNSSSEQ